MNKQSEKIEKAAELTLEQMDMIFGGAGAETQNLNNTGNISGSADSGVSCASSPNGEHKWFYYNSGGKKCCMYCRQKESCV